MGSMHLEKFDLNLLVAIEAMMRLRSVTAAADELHLTQSAMSSALKRARQHFSDDLLYYDGQRMVPTPFGRELEARVPDMVAQLRSLTRMRAGRDLSRVQRKFTIIASDYVAAVYVSALSRSLAQIAPGIRLAVVSISRESLDQFQRGVVDFLIVPDVTLAPEFPVAGFDRDLLFEDEFECALWRDNPVLATGFTPEAYFDLPHVLSNFELLGGNSHFERWLATHRAQMTIAASLPSFVLLPQFIAGTRNVATIHKRLKPLFAGHDDLVFVDPPEPIPTLQEFLITNSKHQHDTEAELLKQHMLTLSRTMPDPLRPSRA